jgi:3-oxoacyl-(acyl-carrier-protein) synthase
MQTQAGAWVEGNPGSFLTRDCDAGTEVSEYGYVALHGTGTPLGDPIEMGALGQALAGPNSLEAVAPKVTIGSVKSCYGHSEGAAGLTGPLLAVQALRHQVTSSHFPPSRGIFSPCPFDCYGLHKHGILEFFYDQQECG